MLAYNEQLCVPPTTKRQQTTIYWKQQLPGGCLLACSPFLLLLKLNETSCEAASLEKKSLAFLINTNLSFHRLMDEACRLLKISLLNHHNQ